MTTTYVILITVALATLAAAIKRNNRSTRSAGLTENSPLRARPIMTANEREAYARLKTAMPTTLILPQVSLGSFIETRHGRDQQLRNRYERLTADFIICDANSTPLAIIEIDDRSHGHPAAKARDARKNIACKAANLQIVRWPATPLPTVDTIRARLGALTSTAR